MKNLIRLLPAVLFWGGVAFGVLGGIIATSLTFLLLGVVVALSAQVVLCMVNIQILSSSLHDLVNALDATFAELLPNTFQGEIDESAASEGVYL